MRETVIVSAARTPFGSFLRKYVMAGRLGVKSGRGFYEYPAK